ncbi:hypothetical protein HRbin17_02558 [bacterium HR17]|uniref:Uncharacterized protein n=1 Tax=Candidatus Fervidibacter japonicus TaxID=2035412 RepID=A0A2H5XFQ8_9BACT|nr:hypothetical protein HRbin17_02558 [bacterium HR17]
MASFSFVKARRARRNFACNLGNTSTALTPSKFVSRCAHIAALHGALKRTGDILRPARCYRQFTARKNNGR